MEYGAILKVIFSGTHLIKNVLKCTTRINLARVIFIDVLIIGLLKTMYIILNTLDGVVNVPGGLKNQDIRAQHMI